MLTQAQKTQVAAVATQYANIEGSYSCTLLAGIAHYMCDSGIETDAHAAHSDTLHREVLEKLFAITSDVEAAAAYAAEYEETVLL
jgi:hypothetical protein